MAVLVEALSLIARIDAVRENYVGGLEAFVADNPGDSLCMDGSLIRVGFLSLAEADVRIHELEARGLQYLQDGLPRDMLLVDQVRGPSAPCDWLEVGIVELAPGRRVMAARLAGSDNDTLVTPKDWRYERSHSAALARSPLN